MRLKKGDRVKLIDNAIAFESGNQAFYFNATKMHRQGLARIRNRFDDLSLHDYGTVCADECKNRVSVRRDGYIHPSSFPTTVWELIGRQKI